MQVNLNISIILELNDPQNNPIPEQLDRIQQIKMGLEERGMLPMINVNVPRGTSNTTAVVKGPFETQYCLKANKKWMRCPAGIDRELFAQNLLQNRGLDTNVSADEQGSTETVYQDEELLS